MQWVFDTIDNDTIQPCDALSSGAWDCGVEFVCDPAWNVNFTQAFGQDFCLPEPDRTYPSLAGEEVKKKRLRKIQIWVRLKISRLNCLDFLVL